MGNKLSCINKESINKILQRNNELNEDDFLNFDNNENISTNSIEKPLNINHENEEYILNNPNGQNNENINSIEDKQYKIYNMKDLNKTQYLKLEQLIESFNSNGKPRSSNDFSHHNYTKFYPKDDPYFYIPDTGIMHNQLKIYNDKDINNIELYEGDLNKNEERHGIGKLITPYYVLIGMWRNDKFSGWGRESRCNGDVFEGRFEDGLINGKGIFLDENKNKYIGDFINMKRWGNGKWITKKILYEGEFYNNEMNGNGKIKFFKSGIEYIGTFKNNQIDGYGIFKWINGDKYEGEVKNGKMHGKGKYKFNNGKIYEGEFFDGQINDKNIIVKSLKDNKKNGIIRSINTFDYKKKFRNIDMDNYTFDETRNYILKYNIPTNNIKEGKTMSIYKFNSKINLDNSYNTRTFKPLIKNIFDSKRLLSKSQNNNDINILKSFQNQNPNSDDNNNDLKNISKSQQLEPIQEITEYIVNDNDYSKYEIGQIQNTTKDISNNNKNNLGQFPKLNDFIFIKDSNVHNPNNEEIQNVKNIYENNEIKENTSINYNYNLNNETKNKEFIEFKVYNNDNNNDNNNNDNNNNNNDIYFDLNNLTITDKNNENEDFTNTNYLNNNYDLNNNEIINKETKLEEITESINNNLINNVEIKEADNIKNNKTKFPDITNYNITNYTKNKQTKVNNEQFFNDYLEYATNNNELQMNTINIVEQKIVNNDFVDNIYDMYFPYIENVLIKDNTINNEIKKK